MNIEGTFHICSLRSGVLVASILLAGLAKPVQAAFPNGYSYCKIVSTNHAMVSGSNDLTNYPLTVVLTDADLKTTANGGLVNNSNGYDIGFYPDCSGAGPALKWEVESYSPTAGTIIAHVLRPTLSHTQDDTIGMYYGGGFSSFQSTASAVWSSAYKFVAHLPNGVSALSAADSTSNAVALASGNSTTYGTGKVDGAASMNGTSNYLDYGIAPGLVVGTSDLTVSAWFNTSAAAAQAIVDRTRAAAGDGRYAMYLDATGKVNAFLGAVNAPGGAYQVNSTATYEDGGWHFAVFAVNRSGNATLYVDGVSTGTPVNVTTYAGTGVNLNQSNKFYIGQYGDSTGTGPLAGLYFNGRIDEVRVRIGAGDVRDVDWVQTEYRNQGAPATYLSLGARVTPAGGTGARHSVRSGI